VQCWSSILILIFGSPRTAQLSALGSGRTLHQRKFLGIDFCYSLSGPQDYFKNFQGPYQESKPKPSFLWRSAQLNTPPPSYLTRKQIKYFCTARSTGYLMTSCFRSRTSAICLYYQSVPITRKEKIAEPVLRYV
jgi:hypothetical protein